MSYNDRMAAILIADHKRFIARLEAEANGQVLPDSYLHSRDITGQPSEPNRQHKASDDCWKRGLSRDRTVGTAGGQTQSVKVTKNGRTTIESARGFGRTSIATKQTRYTQTRVARDRQLLSEMSSNHEGDV